MVESATLDPPLLLDTTQLSWLAYGSLAGELSTLQRWCEDKESRASLTKPCCATLSSLKAAPHAPHASLQSVWVLCQQVVKQSLTDPPLNLCLAPQVTLQVCSSAHAAAAPAAISPAHS
jgi:hypothetical protein